MARELRTRPTDLTALARRNKGVYPRDRVRDFVTGTGRTTAAHGTTEMPIWGPLFRAFESDARARVRVENIVGYIETLQVPSTWPGEAGARLFNSYCASCHAADARGAGPLAVRLRIMPPDLTTFTERNGGVFPRERVRRIIDGRHVAAHGSRDMPVWGDSFKREPGVRSDAKIDARIDAIVGFLEGIQRRGTR